MKVYLVARGESASVLILKEGEVTEEPILTELNLDGFGPMSELIATFPDPEKWVRLLELMLCDVLKHGLITGAALMCGTFQNQVEAMREAVARNAIAAAPARAAKDQPPAKEVTN